MASKNLLRSTLILLVILSLAACSTIQLPWETANPAVNNSSELATDTKLAAGILKLEKTDLAVKPDQAKQLALLWKAVRTLAVNDSTSTQEMAALYRQIKETLTPEQAAAVDQVTLTNEDLTALVRELGAQMAGSPGPVGGQGAPSQGQRPQGGSSSRSQGQGGAGGFQGGMPGGGMPGGGVPGGGMPGGDFGGGAPGSGVTGNNARPSTSGQPSSARAIQLGNTQLIDLLIRILDERAKS